MLDPNIRRGVLRPLERRRQQLRDRRALVEAILTLEDRARVEHALPQLVEAQKQQRHAGVKRDWSERPQVAEQVKIARMLYEARRISRSEYVFYISLPIQHFNDSLILEDQHSDLEAVNRAIEAYLTTNDLDLDEIDTSSESEEFRILNQKYSDLVDKHFVQLLREFDVHDLADLHDRDVKEFERLRKRGWRALHHKDEFIAALKDVVLRYEYDAKRAAEARAYSAAVTLLGAGLEGLLLLRCLKSRSKATKMARSFPKSRRPRYIEDPSTWSFEALIGVCESAGWLPTFGTDDRYFRAGSLAHAIRLMRNNVHPGRQAREAPWSETSERDYADAEGIYVLLLSLLDSWPREVWKRGG